MKYRESLSSVLYKISVGVRCQVVLTCRESEKCTCGLKDFAVLEDVPNEKCFEECKDNSCNCKRNPNNRQITDFADNWK